MQIEKNPLWRIGKHPLLWGCLLLAAVTILNNWPMAAFDFAWDDYGYVVRNYPIQDPVSLKSLLWCLTAFAEANWHPMTWLALHLQFQFFGLNPSGYHVTNLLLHIANTLLVYALLYRTTRAVGKSLFVAALFSVHPLHIESVAWISEIKDVLSTFFFLLMLHAYASYARRPGIGRYSLVGIMLALGLASKPMLVTAPFVMLLLDYWPLGRWTGGPEAALPDVAGPRYPARRLILEKLPFFATVGVVCVLTFLAQREGGAVSSLAAVPLFIRLGNIANSYIMYVRRMAWPWPLSFFYPYQPVPLGRFALCISALLTITYLSWFTRKSKPYLICGWFFYLGTLVPVIGLVQVGSQALADRYTYIPSIGIFIALSWLFDDLRKHIHCSILLPAALAISIISISMCISLDYLLKWSSEEELYSYGLSINENNAIALNNYGLLLAKKQDYQKATEYFTKNIAITPISAGSKTNLALIYLTKDDPQTALKLLIGAQQENPNNASGYMALGQVFNYINDTKTAEALYRKSYKLPKDRLRSAFTLSDILIRKKQYKEALEIAQENLPLAYDKDPAKALLLWNAGRAFQALGQNSNATDAFNAALKLQPIFPGAYHGLASIALSNKDQQQAIELLRRALKTYSADATAHTMLGQIYASQGRYGRAYTHLRRALNPYQRLEPEAKILAMQELIPVLHHFGRLDEANRHAAEMQDLQKGYPPHIVKAMRDDLFRAISIK